MRDLLFGPPNSKVTLQFRRQDGSTFDVIALRHVPKTEAGIIAAKFDKIDLRQPQRSVIGAAFSSSPGKELPAKGSSPGKDFFAAINNVANVLLPSPSLRPRPSTPPTLPHPSYSSPENSPKRRMPQFVAMDAEQEKAYVELKELFKHFDTDGSGELASDEVGELLGTMGVNVNAEELAKLIQMMDVDCSGSFMCLRHLCAVLHVRVSVRVRVRVLLRVRVRVRVRMLTSREQQVQYLWRS